MPLPSFATDDEPTPVPASEQRPTSTKPSSSQDVRRSIADDVEAFAQCRSLEELPAELQGNPFIRYLVSMTPEEQAQENAAAEAHQEAEALYEDDPERILAAIEAGTHPLQRRPPSPRPATAPSPRPTQR